MTEELLTVREASESFHIHPTELYERKHEIGFIKRPGIPILFPRKNLEKWLEEGCNKPAQLAEVLPKFNIFLAGYDKLFLERRTEMKGAIRWSYPFGSVLMRKTKKGEERYYIDYQVDSYRVRKVVKGARTRRMP